MGRPKDRKERELARAYDELEKGIARGDGERAAEALLALPPADRLPHLATTAPLFAAAVQRAHAEPSRARLAQLAALASKEPQLVDSLAHPKDLPVRWALMSGAVQRSDWDGAKSQLAGLRADLEQRAPRLLVWLDAWLLHRGTIPDTLSLPPLLVRDERLGDEQSTRPRPPDSPKTLEQVESAVLTAAATLRPADHRALMLDWVRTLPPLLALATRTLAGKLALRAALRGVAQGQYLAPLSLLAALAERNDQPPRPAAATEAEPDLSQDLLLGLRLAIHCRRNRMTDEEARVLSALAMAVAKDPLHRVVVISYIASVPFPPAQRPQALTLHQQLLALQLEPPLLASAITYYMQELTEAPPPSWLLDGVVRLLSPQSGSSQDPTLVAWLGPLPNDQRTALLDFLREEAPPALGLKLADLAWADADAGLRHQLASLVVDLIEALPAADPQHTAQLQTIGDYLSWVRREGVSLPPDFELDLGRLPSRMPFSENVRKILAHAVRRAGLGRSGSYDSRQRREIQRFSARLLGTSLAFAGLAMTAAASEPEAIDTARTYLEGSAQAEDAVVLLRVAHLGNRIRLATAILQHTLTRWGGDLPSMVRLLLRLAREDAPRQVLKPIAVALLQADTGASAPQSQDYLTARGLARRLIPLRERKAFGIPEPAAVAKPAKPPTGRKAGAKAASKSESGTKRPKPQLSSSGTMYQQELNLPRGSQ